MKGFWDRRVQYFAETGPLLELQARWEARGSVDQKVALDAHRLWNPLFCIRSKRKSGLS